MNLTISPLEIYTDGAAKGNGYEHCSGGWGYYILKENSLIRYDSGCVLNTTNNRMEIYAILKAIKDCEKFYKDDGSAYVIYTDSAYIYNCWVQGWYQRWYSNGFRNAKNKPVANADLWPYLIPYFNNIRYKFVKVKGHSENIYNKYVDKLADEAAKSMRGIIDDGDTLIRNL